LSLNNAKVLYNGVKNISVPSKTKNLRKELDLPEDTFLLGTIGNFGKARDYLTVVKAFKIVAKKRKKIHYAIIGRFDTNEHSDYYKSREFVINNGLEKNVHFLGARADASQYLNSFDAFIYSSKRETFGMSVIEALVAGLPTIVNDLPVFQELTENGKYAIIYQTKNFENLSNKLNNMLDNFAFYKDFFNKNSQKIYKKFSIDEHIIRLKTYYGKDKFFKG
jgi:glycosyltransferase involved in cell wall biosynthesis